MIFWPSLIKINSLTPVSDQDLISPHSNTATSFNIIMTITEMIANPRSFDCYTNFPCQHQRKCMKKSLKKINTDVMVLRVNLSNDPGRWAAIWEIYWYSIHGFAHHQQQYIWTSTPKEPEQRHTYQCTKMTPLWSWWLLQVLLVPCNVLFQPVKIDSQRLCVATDIAQFL